MARRDDRSQTQRTGQWTHYRGRWWQFTGTGWVASDEPPPDAGDDPGSSVLRYHRDGSGTYWLQHPRTDAWYRNEDGSWVPSPDPPPDLDPDPLTPQDAGRRASPRPAGTRRSPRPARLIIALSVLLLLGVAVLLLVDGGSGGNQQKGSPPTTSSSVAAHGHPTVPVTPPTTAVTPSPTSTAPVPARVLVTASGTGNGQTSLFTVRSPSWHLHYSFDCSNEGPDVTDNFIVNVNGSGAASGTTDQGVNTVGGAESGSQHYTDRGTFNLTVTTNCSWKVRAAEP
jgi:hypothetical protein